ncbi:hypothetical protein GCM10010393_05750 [Streptomyces gobitricini]|uniref:Uncharacterized protein n=1 Tax=Streptomyces gobitricini TaxID=68211 RepID=A0ABN3L8K8_9ACTN
MGTAMAPAVSAVTGSIGVVRRWPRMVRATGGEYAGALAVPSVAGGGAAADPGREPASGARTWAGKNGKRNATTAVAAAASPVRTSARSGPGS